ncbi:DUF262 domain-containing protein [Methylobacterium sp. W2]|uniref:DUF262 domain-containing protein n=1 Tax=Methylobacterium sp. W2 TaxID=2598107 RepID=UPI001D0CC841|nr:DUF262 domain-containing protein [Methylobacterium sp. W2]MCC0807530.1 DUF262 domain-containing protein [Methylobacterium sp. W2]
MTDLPAEHEAIDASTVELPPEEASTFEGTDSSEPVPPVDIIAYNEVRSCADLYRLFSSGRMEIQPDFQRDVVWKREERTRFIDSLVKQLPIPSMCFSLDPKTQRWKVIDGLQRMTSITDFLGKTEWQLSSLDDIHPILRGNTNTALKMGPEDHSILYSSVENVTIPVTVIRCDYTKREHMRYLFTIFHRLNSGGVRLNNQEIRNCIYTGAFNDALKDFDNKHADWQVVKARIWGSVNRFRSVEILLRILAFSERLESYEGNLADFLNHYMHDHAEASPEIVAEKIAKLKKAATITRTTLEDQSGKLSLAIIEAVLVASVEHSLALSTISKETLNTKYYAMLSMPAFAEGARYAVSSVENVQRRLTEATEAFGR